MTAEADPRADDRSERRPATEPPDGPSGGPATPPRAAGRFDLTLDRYAVAIGAVVVGQAVWLAVLMSGGWFYEADFSNLAAASGRSLSWSYLSQSQGGHLDIIGRAVFLLLNRIDPLNYPLTVALRLVAQGYATYLLARLLILLVGRRAGVLVVLALYAFSPLLVQSILFLTSSVNFLLSQIFLLWALRAHVRYSLDRQLRHAVGAASAMLAATLVSEQAAVTALILPLLSVGYLHAGTVRRRVVSTLRSWPEWLMIGLPIVAFVLFFLGSGKYNNGRLHTGARGIASSVWDEWRLSILPGMLGGPLRWLSGPGVYFSLADPPQLLRIAAPAVVAAAVVVSVRRTGLVALLAWAMPFVVSGVGIAVVAVGRYTAFGGLIARQFEHAAYAALPLAVAVALAFWATGPEQIAARLAGRSAPSPAAAARRPRRRLPAPVIPALLSLVVAAASVFSAVRYAQRWWQAPARGYVTALESHLRALGPQVSLFDTYVSGRLLPVIADYRRMSDLVGLLDLPGVKVRFNTGPAPRVVDDHGRVVPAGFFVQSHVEIGHDNPLCNDPIVGTEARPQALQPRPGENEWFVKIEYFEQFPSILYVEAVDDGHRVQPVGGRRILLTDRLGRTYLRLPRSRPSALVIRGSSSATRVCVTKVELGYPFPREGS